MKKNPTRKEQVKEIIQQGNGPLRLVVGAGGIRYSGWIDTDLDILDILEEEEWRSLLGNRKIDMLLSEHVLEHIAPEEQLNCVKLCFRFLRSGGLFRVAVPDGYRQDAVYREEIMPPKDGHTMVFTYLSLQNLLQAAGFQTNLLEYFDENGLFHACDWDPEQGMIRRSARFDTQERFQIQAGQHSLKYTSLIIDGVKP